MPSSSASPTRSGGSACTRSFSRAIGRRHRRTRSWTIIAARASPRTRCPRATSSSARFRGTSRENVAGAISSWNGPAASLHDAENGERRLPTALVPAYLDAITYRGLIVHDVRQQPWTFVELDHRDQI